MQYTLINFMVHHLDKRMPHDYAFLYTLIHKSIIPHLMPLCSYISISGLQSSRTLKDCNSRLRAKLFALRCAYQPAESLILMPPRQPLRAIKVKVHTQQKQLTNTWIISRHTRGILATYT